MTGPGVQVSQTGRERRNQSGSNASFILTNTVKISIKKVSMLSLSLVSTVQRLVGKVSFTNVP